MRRGFYGLMAMAAAFWMTAGGPAQAALMQGDWEITLIRPSIVERVTTFTVDATGIVGLNVTIPGGINSTAVYSGNLLNNLAAPDRIQGELFTTAATSRPGTPVLTFFADGTWFCGGVDIGLGNGACLIADNSTLTVGQNDGVPGTYELTKLGPVNPVPLPATAWLLLTAIAGLGLFGRRRG